MASYHYRSPQELHLLSILARSVSRQATGCLQISDGTHTWRLFLEQGKLVYAYSSIDPFGRLDRYLRRLSSYIPSLASPVRVQVRLLFENPVEDPNNLCRDYEAICWLVDQQYLTTAQAAELVEILAKDVLETLLPLQTGNHNLIEKDLLSDWPRFCALDVRSLVESCQIKPTRRPLNTGTTPPSPIQPLRVPEPRPQQPPTRPVMPSSQSVRPSAEQSHVGSSERRSLPSLTKTTYTIACIDDSPTVLSAIEAFLDDKAFKVIRIENPVSALMTIIRNKPDLILLDVTMPSLDGYELCSLLRRHPAFKHTPIIMVTGNRGFIDRAKAKLVGASGYLTKPFTQPDLLKIIFKHLN